MWGLKPWKKENKGKVYKQKGEDLMCWLRQSQYEVNVVTAMTGLFLTETRGRFHQRSTYSFYTRRSQKRKNTVKSSISFLRFQDLRA